MEILAKTEQIARNFGESNVGHDDVAYYTVTPKGKYFSVDLYEVDGYHVNQQISSTTDTLYI
jgi:hypothetical protein